MSEPSEQTLELMFGHHYEMDSELTAEALRVLQRGTAVSLHLACPGLGFALKINLRLSPEARAQFTCVNPEEVS